MTKKRGFPNCNSDYHNCLKMEKNRNLQVAPALPATRAYLEFLLERFATQCNNAYSQLWSFQINV